jgi:CubicO group peptidase (beta-lactamase class C family)
MDIRTGVSATFPRQSIEARVRRVLIAARVPGAIIAVVTRKEHVLTRAFGLRDVAAPAAMLEDTRYPVASTTKGITATLIAQLVEAGLLDWDVPVRRYMPEFRLKDATATYEITLRDLITMRTGLPRHDWTWIGSDIARADLVHRLACLDPSGGFRDRFQYNNLTVTAAAHIAEQVTGESWETLVRERILNPLRMDGAGFGWTDDPVIMTAYHENPLRALVRTEPFAAAATGPSGGAIIAGINDMARWAQFNLGDGTPLLRPGGLAALHTPQIGTGEDASAPSRGAAYGLGWFVDTYRGTPRISHGGYLADINSEIALYPKRDLAILTVTNFGAPRVARLLADEIFDAIHDVQDDDRVDRHLADYEAKIAKRRAAASLSGRSGATQPSNSLPAYSGRFRDDGYGVILISAEEDVLVLRLNAWRFQLVHWDGDAWTFAAAPGQPLHAAHPFDDTSLVKFEAGENGDVAALRILLEPAVPPIRFARVTDHLQESP